MTRHDYPPVPPEHGWPGWCQNCGAPLDPPDALWCRACGASDDDE